MHGAYNGTALRGTSIASCQPVPLAVTRAVALSWANFAHYIARAFSSYWAAVACKRADVLVPTECSVAAFCVQCTATPATVAMRPHMHSRSGIHRSKECTDGTVAWIAACLAQAQSDPSTEPRHYQAALSIPHWRAAMDLEF
jgi:hypothetical protein